ncbi:hypothetical protein [Kaistia terrae]|uniref:Uncharacterized protein n=1 Tax=Kaistia terrae TaxID=537017 RepID=A0ABW0Q2B0_9HYPH|nr:hypothetical protein [Kaistia terrae]MCX5581508.1 hypothetical protein [Kaistia terrae]
MTHHVIHAYRRQQLELWIERAIALLDELDGDTDLEAGADHERDETEIISDLTGLAQRQFVGTGAEHLSVRRSYSVAGKVDLGVDPKKLRSSILLETNSF